MITWPKNIKIAGIFVLTFLVGALALSQAGMAGRITQASVIQAEEPTHQIMMPVVFSQGYTNEMLKGTVLDANGQSVARVTVVTNDGRYAYTDEDGEYALSLIHI